MSFKYRINWSKNESEQKPWSMESPEHSSGSVDSGRKSNVNTSRWDKHQLKSQLTMFMVLSLPWNWRTLLLFEAVQIVGSSSSSSSWQTCYRYVTMLKKNFQNQREKKRSHRVLRLGLHPRQGWVGGVEMREHLSISWSENLKQRKNEILIVNLRSSHFWISLKTKWLHKKRIDFFLLVSFILFQASSIFQKAKYKQKSSKDQELNINSKMSLLSFALFHLAIFSCFFSWFKEHLNWNAYLSKRFSEKKWRC